MTRKHQQTLREFEGRIRALSVDIWEATVGDPETATVASEKAGMTPEREELVGIYKSLDVVAEAVEELINAKLGGSR